MLSNKEIACRWNIEKIIVNFPDREMCFVLTSDDALFSRVKWMIAVIFIAIKFACP
jgi:hypothetical protein